MNWENRHNSKIVVIDEIPHHIEQVKEVIGESCAIQVVRSPFKLISFLCAEKPDVVVVNSAINWFRTDTLCRAINNAPALADTPIVLYNTENTTVNAANVHFFRNCHITPDPSRAAEEARRLITR